MTQYSNDHSRLLDRLVQQADALATKATSFLERLAAAKADAANLEGAFVASLDNGAVRDLAEAQSQVRNLGFACAAIDAAGGAKGIRDQALQAPIVFSTLARGFAERASVLEKMPAPALKRLGQRRAALTEAGVDFQLIEHDPHVSALRNFVASVAPALADAKFNQVYSEARGVNREFVHVDQLIERLTRPLPQVPAEPAV